jgi:hypothetical protein
MATKRRPATRGKARPKKPTQKPRTETLRQRDRLWEPWLVVPGVPVLGLVCGAIWSNLWAKLGMAILMLLVTAAVSWAGYRYSSKREEFQRRHVGFTIAGSGAAIVVWMFTGWGSAIGTGQVTGPGSGIAAAVKSVIHPTFAAQVWGSIYIVGAAGVVLAWNIRRSEVVRGDGRDDHDESKGWDEVVGLPGSRARIVDQTADHVRVRVRTAGGQDADDVSKAARAIQAIIPGARMGSIRAVPSPSGLAVERDLIMMKRDPLEKPPSRPEWDGQRRSIVDGFRPGLCEDASPVAVHVAGGKKMPPTNMQVMGGTRTGKSHFFRLCTLDISECDDVVLWVSDTIKGAQTIKPLMPAIDWFARTKSETHAMLAALDKVVRARADDLGRRGYDEWSPKCGFPLLIVWIEEAARVLGDSERFVRLAESVLSAGVVLVNSMQRASHDNLPTSARANIAAAVCFAVRSDTDASFVLPDDVMETQVAHLWYTELERRQGYFYAVAPGVSPEQRPMAKRTWWMDRADIERAVAANAPGMAALDDLSVRAAGEAYANRSAGRNVGASSGGRSGPSVDGNAPGYVDGTVDGWPGPSVDDEADDDYFDDVDDDELTVVEIDPEDARDMDEIDPREPLPEVDGPDVEFGPQGTPGPELTGAARHEAWLGVLDEVARRQPPQDDGSVTVEMSDLLDAWLQVPGVSPSTRPWLHERLNELINHDPPLAERLRKGRYRLLPGKPGVTAPVTAGDRDGPFVSAPG